MVGMGASPRFLRPCCLMQTVHSLHGVGVCGGIPDCFTAKPGLGTTSSKENTFLAPLHISERANLVSYPARQTLSRFWDSAGWVQTGLHRVSGKMEGAVWEMLRPHRAALWARAGLALTSVRIGSSSALCRHSQTSQFWSPTQHSQQGFSSLLGKTASWLMNAMCGEWDCGLGLGALGIMARGWEDVVGGRSGGRKRAAHLNAPPQPALSLPWRECHSNIVLLKHRSLCCHCRAELGNLIKELAADKLCELKAFY